SRPHGPSAHPLPIDDLRWVDSVLENVRAVLADLLFVLAYDFPGPRRELWIPGRDLLRRLDDDMVATRAIAHVHVERSRRRTFLAVAVEVETVVARTFPA